MRRILIEKEMMDPKHCSYGFPWKSDGPCFNFRMPEECVLAEDIDIITHKDNIETLVIGCDLDSYDFISDMVNLKFLYIYKGNNVKNLDFVKKLGESVGIPCETLLRCLYIETVIWLFREELANGESLEECEQLITNMKTAYEFTNDYPILTRT